jgi:hypothetical protein
LRGPLALGVQCAPDVHAEETDMRASTCSLILILAASCGPTFTEEELTGDEAEVPEAMGEEGGEADPANPIPAANYAWDDLGGCSVGGASGACIDT